MNIGCMKATSACSCVRGHKSENTVGFYKFPRTRMQGAL